jgi:hypothetical protein
VDHSNYCILSTEQSLNLVALALLCQQCPPGYIDVSGIHTTPSTLGRESRGDRDTLPLTRIATCVSSSFYAALGAITYVLPSLNTSPSAMRLAALSSMSVDASRGGGERGREIAQLISGRAFLWIRGLSYRYANDLTSTSA